MKSAAVLILIAGVIGADGDTFRIEAGRLAGLRVGDTGALFYQLTVRDDVRRVEVGTAEVTAVEDATATLRVAPGVQVRDGYRVEFSVPATRLDRREAIRRAPDETVELRRRLEAGDRRIGELERELESSLAARAELERSLEAARAAGRSQIPKVSDEQLQRLRDAQEGRAAAEARARELEERLVASQMHAGAALAAAQVEVDAARAEIALLRAELQLAEIASPEIAPPEIVQAPESPQVEAATDPTAGMIRLDSARYEIGLPVVEASFYNQTPRFSRQIAALWVDSQPVTEAEFARVSGAPPPSNPTGFKAGVTFEEAAGHCRSVGKRLPTEVEWEAALTSLPIEGQPSLLEWTSSWYEAYPGNERTESDYGRRFRVIRASSGSRRDRRYMVPADRDGSVGFRCVRPDSAGSN